MVASNNFREIIKFTWQLIITCLSFAGLFFSIESESTATTIGCLIAALMSLPSLYTSLSNDLQRKIENNSGKLLYVAMTILLLITMYYILINFIIYSTLRVYVKDQNGNYIPNIRVVLLDVSKDYGNCDEPKGSVIDKQNTKTNKEVKFQITGRNTHKFMIELYDLSERYDTTNQKTFISKDDHEVTITLTKAND